MRNWMRYYRQNRVTVWAVIIVIVSVIGIIQLINQISINQMNRMVEDALEQENWNSIADRQRTIPVRETSSAMGTGNITESQAVQNRNILSQFIEYANSGRVEEAYNLLSEESKEINYPTLQHFIDNYHSRIFNEYRLYNTQMWIEGPNRFTYKVEFVPDILTSGNVTRGNTITDYITVVRRANGELRLNINNYVDRIEMNHRNSRSGVEIRIIHKDIFMDYKTYEFEIRNGSDRRILLNNRSDATTIFLEDDNGNRYSSRIHEVEEALLVFERGFSRRLNIRFSKVYGTRRETRGVVFTNIIMDVERYLQEGVIEDDNFENIGILL